MTGVQTCALPIFVPAVYVVAVCVLALGLLGYAVSQHPSQHPKETHVG